MWGMNNQKQNEQNEQIEDDIGSIYTYSDDAKSLTSDLESIPFDNLQFQSYMIGQQALKQPIINEVISNHSCDLPIGSKVNIIYNPSSQFKPDGLGSVEIEMSDEVENASNLHVAANFEILSPKNDNVASDGDNSHTLTENQDDLNSLNVNTQEVNFSSNHDELVTVIIDQMSHESIKFLDDLKSGEFTSN